MTITSAADLLGALAAARLLDPAQLAQVNQALQGRSPDPRTVARELVKRGWLTPFQVNELLLGRGAELVLGPYLLLERLGEGGMGQVFKARHQLMNRTVAVKVIRKELLANPDSVQRFHREIRLAAQLDHPHLVRAHDAAQVGDTHFLVMEYAEGIDLQQFIRKSGPLPVGQACVYIRQAALGLQHASERGLIHRDIKPSNLQVTLQGTVVKILDMGLARAQAANDGEAGRPELTQTRTIMGTPDYIAPEQIVDPRRVDIRADIYSLGCTFYFLLAGRPPFPGDAWEEKLVSHRKAEPQPIEQLRPDVHPAVGAILRKMMAKRPEDRYLTPVAIADALAPFCGVAGPTPAVAGAAPGAGPQHSTLSAHQTPSPSPAAPPSLVNRATGYEPGWTIKPDPTMHPGIAPVTPFTQPTVLAPEQQPPYAAPGQPLATPSTSPRPGARKRGLLLVLGGAAGLGLLVLLLVLVLPKSDGKRGAGGGKNEGGDDKVAQGSDKDSRKTDAPVKLIDENFRDAFKKGLNIPEGWKEGDAFRIVKVNDEPCLEVGTQAGTPFVTLPRMKLSGNFSIDGDYIMSYYHKLAIRLENSKSNVPLSVVIDYTGSVHIADDLRTPLPSYKPHLPTKFQVTRKGTHLKVALNDQVVGDIDLGAVTEFKTLKLGMTAVPSYHGRLYRLKVVSLAP